jgi:alkylation response protein AidB-like acyl-CoA dehydrogenase
MSDGAHTLHDTSGYARLREQVRTLAQAHRDATGRAPRCDAWLSGYDPEFSRGLGRAGLLGMSWAAEHGGGQRTFRERLVVTEELLRAGAPVAAHWIADRQIGPAIAELGSDTLRRELLPRIARGEACVCLGMSEPESGSDLASVRTRLERRGDGFTLHGQKIWTSNAHVADYAYVLARTDATGGRHEGLTECIVAMDQPGVEVRPIHDLRGEHHFNEVFFDGAHVPADWVIGEEGRGWEQVTAQLSFERGGPERVLSTYPVLATAVHRAGDDDHARVVVGGLAARLTALRAMAWSVAGHMDAGLAPVAEAAGLKLLGTRFEVDVIEAVRELLGGVIDPGDAISALWSDALLASPGFSIRGGTSEVLATILARHCASELAAGTTARIPAGSEGSMVDEVVPDVLADAWTRGDAADEHAATVTQARELGWHLVGVAASAGGVGGDTGDRVRLAELLGEHACDGPLLEANTALARLAGLPGVDDDHLRAGRVAVVLDDDWAAPADRARVDATGGIQTVLVVVGDAIHATRSVGTITSVAGTALQELEIDPEPLAEDADRARGVRFDLDLLRCARLVGAARSAATASVRHAAEREQFGRPLLRFQAVGALLAEQRATVELATAAVTAAMVGPESSGAARLDAAAWVCDEGAGDVARRAHQVHGAMGTTHEHHLHRVTRRLWSWRDQLGGQRVRARRLGAWVLEQGEATAWEALGPDAA